MFEFLRDNLHDVFMRRKRQREVCLSMRRILDATCPEVSPPDANNRNHSRYHRTVPAVVIPACREGLAVDEALFGVTRDLSDVGACLLVLQELKASEAVCGFWVESAVFMYGKVVRTERFGAGLWLLGLHFLSALNTRDSEPLLPLAKLLRPEAIFSDGLPRRGQIVGV
jgi:hypothetical protein